MEELRGQINVASESATVGSHQHPRKGKPLRGMSEPGSTQGHGEDGCHQGLSQETQVRSGLVSPSLPTLQTLASTSFVTSPSIRALHELLRIVCGVKPALPRRMEEETNKEGI